MKNVHGILYTVCTIHLTGAMYGNFDPLNNFHAVFRLKNILLLLDFHYNVYFLMLNRHQYLVVNSLETVREISFTDVTKIQTRSVTALNRYIWG